jgi:1,2-diacylglycerol 3-alpha-glucosyltransferase
MKILILNSILYTPKKNIIDRRKSITDTMIYNFANSFVQQGHEVTLVASYSFSPLFIENYPFNILFFKNNFSKIFLPTVLPLHIKLLSYLIKNRKYYDLIISSETFSFNSLFASLIASQKTIIWHELGQHNNKFYQIPSKIWYNIVARIFMSRTLIVPRSFIALNFLKQFGLKVANSYIDHGVNVQHFIPTSKKKKQFIVAACLIQRKRIDTIIDKFNKFLNKYKLYDYKLIIAGDGPCKKQIQEQIKKLDIQNNVLLMGMLSHKILGIYISESCGMLCNTEMDLNMISIGESLSVGTPVLTNTVPYSHEWIKLKKLGIAKDEWNEDDIFSLIQNNDKYVHNALNYGKSLTNDAVAQKFISLYNQFIKK